MHTPDPPAVAVYGCGNTLLGDDGFGPEVIAGLRSARDLPARVLLEDVGTGIREHLFDFLLAPGLAPGLLIILDGVDVRGRDPGEVFTITPTTLPPEKVHDFSLHQFPTVNLLQEIAAHTAAEVRIIAAQVGHVPDRVAPGLSPAMQASVRTAVNAVRRIVTGYLAGAAPGEPVP